MRYLALLLVTTGALAGGRETFNSTVVPAINASCAPCHSTGPARFGFATLTGDAAVDYERWRDLISLDNPAQSRLLMKASGGMQHATTTVGPPAVVATLLAWINQERSERCQGCGMADTTQWLAYVDSPSWHWAAWRDPIRPDWAVRDRSRIMLQRISSSFKPTGAPVDFLGSWCGVDGKCDFGKIAVNHAGTQAAFECRLSLNPDADWVTDVRWNVCIAEIGSDGKAVNPRFLSRSPQGGYSVSRIGPFGLTNANGLPLKGNYDHHFQSRQGGDLTPAFSPDDSRVYYSSRGPDPRMGVTGYQTYHGFEVLDHIVAVRTDGSDPRTIYFNEGGTADHPFFVRSGHLVHHSWLLERIDRHVYVRSKPDGTIVTTELGLLDGPNQWGQATELANGAILGMTGQRRASINDYTPFLSDHTLGTGVDPALQPLRMLDPDQAAEIANLGFCNPKLGKESANCTLSKLYAEPSYSPDGRAFIAYTPRRIYTMQGDPMWQGYATGTTHAQKLASLTPYLPVDLGIALIDDEGAVEPWLVPPAGRMYRHPAWVGKRSPPRVLPWEADETQDSAELHVADLPLWLSFSRVGADKSALLSRLDTITSLRVLVKPTEDNACTSDLRPYRYAVNNGIEGTHPTHLGLSDSTGYEQLLPVAGGDAWGDVPLRPDRSVRVKVPAGVILLLQGVDARGHTVEQRDWVLALPPGTVTTEGVRRDQYASQCASCHGSIAGPFVGLGSIAIVPRTAMTLDTLAAGQPPVDLTGQRRPLTHLAVVRPLLDRSCVSCHSGPSPKGELSLVAEYSPTANYPKGRWASLPAGKGDHAAYELFVPASARVPGYDYSLSYSWAFQGDDQLYRSPHLAKITAHAPLADLAPWDPAYQNLFCVEGGWWRYLSGRYGTGFGRSRDEGGNSSRSWLIEILSGRDISTRGGAIPGHASLLSEAEVRQVMAVIDVGYPYMARCDDETVPSGPNAGKPWGDPVARPVGVRPTPLPSDACPTDPLKTEPGVCGCGVSDADSDSDGALDCNDGCPGDPGKVAPGACGCNVPDTDSDMDGAADCNDECPVEPGKIIPGQCGCDVPDTDTDGDGKADCVDMCPKDPDR